MSEKIKPTLEALKDCNYVQSPIIDNSNASTFDAEGSLHKVEKSDTADKWISVEDELPPMFQRVLVSSENGKIPKIARRWTGCNDAAARMSGYKSAEELFEWLLDIDTKAYHFLFCVLTRSIHSMTST